MERFDLGIAYLWEFDQDFVSMIENTLQDYGISTFIIKEHNVFEVTDRILKKELYFNFYLDRAWDVDDDFVNLGKIIQKKKTVILNPYKKVLHAIDKASMHLEFITAGINVPYSIIMPPYNHAKDVLISLSELMILGLPFIIKPCNTTGGGVGVVTDAITLKEILEERKTNADDKYLIQEKVYPRMIDGKRAWFRCFWAFGKAIITWWDDQTHIYTEISKEEIEQFGLRKLFYITRTIAKLTGLDFFSTEIVMTKNKKFIVIDYVNDQCDMRIKSKHFDGVPDAVANQIINNLLKLIIKLKKS